MPASAASPVHHPSSMDTTLDLHVNFRHRGWRWPLRDGDTLEIWCGQTYRGELSTALLRNLIGYYLASADLAAQLLTRVPPPPLTRRRGNGDSTGRSARGS